MFAELYRKTRELERLNGELRKIYIHLMKMQDEEHRRIARELHDGLRQELAVLKRIVTQIPAYNSIDTRDQVANEASEIVTAQSRTSSVSDGYRSAATS